MGLMCNPVDMKCYVADGGPTFDSMQVIIVDDSGMVTVCKIVTCANHVLQCADCLDNETAGEGGKDGKIDFQDPECLGPCDNTEGPALAAGIGGQTGGPCKADCYFDFGNGAGNDNCMWDHRCDTLMPEMGCPYEQNRVGGRDCPAMQEQKCLDFCRPLTPNGCDCFGCCTFPQLAGMGPQGSDGYVWIGNLDSNNNGTCTLASILDPVKCPRCTPQQSCWNPCGMCEVCIGAPPPPPSCNPSQQCSVGVQPCGLAGQAPCPDGYYCITGCCVQVIL
jgi:hypothetical protein